MKRNPNIVIFMLDTQRTTNVGCYGYEKPTTPNIDKLAEEGVVYLDNISPAIWTLPAVASLMTGVHVHSHGSGARTDVFVGTQPAIAEMLSQKGYRSIAFCDNKFAHSPNRGFDEIHIFPLQYRREDRGVFERSRERVALASRWIDHNYLNDKKRMPFFMYLQMMDPHLPHNPRSPYKEQFVLPDATDEEMSGLNQRILEVHAGKRHFSERERALLKSMYDAETAAADSHVGILADFMREKGILDETIFIVMSDHGDMYGEKNGYNILHDNAFQHFSHHLCVYEELIKVPLVVRYPATFPAGKKVTHYSQTHDIFPTLAEIIGFKAPHCQGFSLLSALEDKPARNFTLTEYSKSVHMASRILTQFPDRDARMYLRSLKAWRAEGMKYIWSSDGADELYDLTKDTEEKKNLIREIPDRTNSMRLAMEEFLMTCPNGMAGDIIQPGKTVSKEALQRLEAMDWLN